MQHGQLATRAAIAAVLFLAACKDPSNAGADVKQYGPAQPLGNGTVRTYVIVDQKDRNVPVEVGVAMSESAMVNLPAPNMAAMAKGAEMNMAAMMNTYLLDLPAQNPTQYKFVQFDWNPMGHEPAGVYDLPHFDFHFYTVAQSVRNSIVPGDPTYATKAALFPGDSLRAPFYIDAATAANAPASAAAVPQMGLHWLDVRSPELQGLTGHPEAYKPFTKTFIYGSWNGEFIFDEPMITRDYILAKHDATDAAVRDELVAVPTAKHYSPAGYYPSAYRISYDSAAKEYRIALTQLVRRN